MIISRGIARRAGQPPLRRCPSHANPFAGERRDMYVCSIRTPSARGAHAQKRAKAPSERARLTPFGMGVGSSTIDSNRSMGSSLKERAGKKEGMQAASTPSKQTTCTARRARGGGGGKGRVSATKRQLTIPTRALRICQDGRGYALHRCLPWVSGVRLEPRDQQQSPKDMHKHNQRHTHTQDRENKGQPQARKAAASATDDKDNCSCNLITARTSAVSRKQKQKKRQTTTTRLSVIYHVN